MSCYKRLMTVVSIVMMISLFSCSNNSEKTANIEQAVGADTYQDETNVGPDVLVTFIELGSVNCIPCKKMMPVMEKLEEKFPKHVKVIFHDVWTDRGKPYGEKYNIRLIPVQVLLDKDGKEFYRHQGFFPYEEIVTILKKQGVTE